MTNGDRGGALADEILRSVAIEYGWPDYRPQEKLIAQVGEETLRSYAGMYRFPNGRTITVAVENRRIWIKQPNADRVEIFPESATSFFSITGGVPPLRFMQKDDKSVELTAGGATAKRQ